MRNSTAKIKVGISACLLGQNVRYNGGHEHSPLCTEELGQRFDFVPTCPEQGAGLGVPRPPIQLVGDPARPRAVHVEDATIEVTEKLERYAAQRIPGLRDLCGYIFIEKSPSCGLFGVGVYQDDGRLQQEGGRGLFAAALTQAMPLLPVEEESRLHDRALRKNFVTRVSALHDWRQLEREGFNTAALFSFHLRYKSTLMERSPADCAALESMLAEAGAQGSGETGARYFARLMQVLQS